MSLVELSRHSMGTKPKLFAAVWKRQALVRFVSIAVSILLRAQA